MAESAQEMRVFVAVGECEAHWIVAEDRAHAGRIIADHVASEWSDEEKLDFERWGPEWEWVELSPDDDLTEEGDGDAPDITKPVREWVREHGAGILCSGEV